jgi:predicted nucleic acid-binding protein
MDAETFATALSTQRELSRLGEHRIPLPELLITSCAQQHSAEVAHVDRHYDVVAGVLSLASRRVA